MIRTKWPPSARECNGSQCFPAWRAVFLRLVPATPEGIEKRCRDRARQTPRGWGRRRAIPSLFVTFSDVQDIEVSGRTPPDTHPKELSRPQNEPWEFDAPRGRSYADPTPACRLGTAICRATD